MKKTDLDWNSIPREVAADSGFVITPATCGAAMVVFRLNSERLGQKAIDAIEDNRIDSAVLYAKLSWKYAMYSLECENAPHITELAGVQCE